MKRLICASLLVLTTCMSLPALADDTAPALSEVNSGSAKILFGVPTSSLISATELDLVAARKCSSLDGMATQGLDAYVIDATGVGTIKVSARPEINATGSPPKLNLAFWGSDCYLKGLHTSKNNGFQTKVPAGTAWAVVSVLSGANIKIDWVTSVS